MVTRWCMLCTLQVELCTHPSIASKMWNHEHFCCFLSYGLWICSPLALLWLLRRTCSLYTGLMYLIHVRVNYCVKCAHDCELTLPLPPCLYCLRVQQDTKWSMCSPEPHMMLECDTYMDQESSVANPLISGPSNSHVVVHCFLTARVSKVGHLHFLIFLDISVVVSPSITKAVTRMYRLPYVICRGLSLGFKVVDSFVSKLCLITGLLLTSVLQVCYIADRVMFYK